MKNIEDSLKDEGLLTGEEPVLEPCFRGAYENTFSYDSVGFCICDCGCDKLVLSAASIVMASVAYIVD